MTLGDDTEEEKPPSQMVLYWRELKTSMKNTAKRPITAIRRTSLYIKYSRRYPHHVTHFTRFHHLWTDMA